MLMRDWLKIMSHENHTQIMQLGCELYGKKATI